jgi:hypothetical protein
MTASFRSRSGREPARGICAALAIVMALASLPAAVGVFVRVTGAPCFKVNVCHPLQSAFPASDSAPLARPAMAANTMNPKVFPAPPPVAIPLAARFLPQPDAPPPKSSV